MFKKLALLTIIALILGLQQVCSAHDNNEIIRVGISNNNFSKFTYENADFTATAPMEILSVSTGKLIKNIQPGESVKIAIKESQYTVSKANITLAANIPGPLIIRTDKSGFIGVKDLKRSGRPALYRGIFDIVNYNGKPNQFCIVNVLDLESYLKGVVPNEMPIRFGLEALKAQTIAARNYALRPREKFYREFDVADSVASQVYFGVNTEKELSNQAIKETNGLIALSKDNEPILALYSSTAGGYTENYELAFSDPTTKAFPANPISYLIAKADNKNIQDLSSDAAAKEYFLSNPETFDNASPYFRWKRQWTQAELSNILSETLIEQSNTGFVKPVLTKKDDFGIIQNISTVRRGKSGKNIILAVTTDKNTYYIFKELVIRRSFKKDQKALPSANFIIEKNIEDNITIFTANGAGFGHGVGMSQYGAGGMASNGYKFDQILQHYYSGVTIGTMPELLSSTATTNTGEQEFYAPYKKAWICIDNIKSVPTIKSVINGKELIIDTSSTTDKKIKVDIKDYINIGENKIVYYIQATNDKNKSARVHVEVKELRNE